MENTRKALEPRVLVVCGRGSSVFVARLVGRSVVRVEVLVTMETR